MSTILTAEIDWQDISVIQPTKTGLYQVKVEYHGEMEVFLSITLSGKLVWVMPDTIKITHWKFKNKTTNQINNIT
jgi:hypothetical protein